MRRELGSLAERAGDEVELAGGVRGLLATKNDRCDHRRERRWAIEGEVAGVTAGLVSLTLAARRI